MHPFIKTGIIFSHIFVPPPPSLIGTHAILPHIFGGMDVMNDLLFSPDNDTRSPRTKEMLPKSVLSGEEMTLSLSLLVYMYLILNVSSYE